MSFFELTITERVDVVWALYNELERNPEKHNLREIITKLRIHNRMEIHIMEEEAKYNASKS